MEVRFVRPPADASDRGGNSGVGAGPATKMLRSLHFSCSGRFVAGPLKIQWDSPLCSRPDLPAFESLAYLAAAHLRTAMQCRSQVIPASLPLQNAVPATRRTICSGAVTAPTASLQPSRTADGWRQQSRPRLPTHPCCAAAAAAARVEMGAACARMRGSVPTVSAVSSPGYAQRGDLVAAEA